MLNEELIKENHQICLKIVDKFLEICSKHHITYYVTEGSALGVVRHHGFIPWDINFDVHLTVDEYHKLDKAMQSENLGEFVWWRPPYRMCSLLQNKEYIDHFTHPNIDITIMGYTSNNKIIRKILLDIAFLNIKMFKLKNTEIKRSFPYNMLKLIASLFPDKLYFGLLNLFINSNQSNRKEYMTAYTPSFYGNTELIKTEWIGNNVTYGDFEGRKVQIMENSHEYLKHRYGDYMTPVVWEDKGEYKQN